MSHVATHRLIDASASLDPAEKALLNLWINRGLDDAALARMTGMSGNLLARRREQVIEHLSHELGLPPSQIRDALVEIAASSIEPQAAGAGANGSSGSPAGADSAPGGSGVAHETEAAPDQPSATPPDTGTEPTAGEDGPDRNGHPSPAAGGVDDALPASTPPPAVADQAEHSSRRRGAWVAGGVGLLLALVVVLLSALGASPGKRRHSHVVTARWTATSIPAPPATGPSPSPTASPPSLALAALPGGLKHGTGSVVLVGKIRSNLKLKLSVKNLPPPRGGHYEVWLYNSILDSESLTKLNAGTHGFEIGLPPDAHRYQWIDISFQPIGFINHSGESVLRSANPAAVSKARLKKRSAHRRHRLRATQNHTHLRS